MGPLQQLEHLFPNIYTSEEREEIVRSLTSDGITTPGVSSQSNGHSYREENIEQLRQQLVLQQYQQQQLQRQQSKSPEDLFAITFPPMQSLRSPSWAPTSPTPVYKSPSWAPLSPTVLSPTSKSWDSAGSLFSPSPKIVRNSPPRGTAFMPRPYARLEPVPSFSSRPPLMIRDKGVVSPSKSTFGIRKRVPSNILLTVVRAGRVQKVRQAELAGVDFPTEKKRRPFLEKLLEVHSKEILRSKGFARSGPLQGLSIGGRASL